MFSCYIYQFGGVKLYPWVVTKLLRLLHPSYMHPDITSAWLLFNFFFS